MEILSMDWGWVGNECGPDRRIGHGYDTMSFQYIRAQVPARELQSSSLGFPHSQPVRSPPQLIASALGASPLVLDSLECQLTLSPFGLFH